MRDWGRGYKLSWFKVRDSTVAAGTYTTHKGSSFLSIRCSSRRPRRSPRWSTRRMRCGWWCRCCPRCPRRGTPITLLHIQRGPLAEGKDEETSDEHPRSAASSGRGGGVLVQVPAFRHLMCGLSCPRPPHPGADGHSTFSDGFATNK